MTEMTKQALWVTLLALVVPWTLAAAKFFGESLDVAASFAASAAFGLALGAAVLGPLAAVLAAAACIAAAIAFTTIGLAFATVFAAASVVGVTLAVGAAFVA